MTAKNIIRVSEFEKLYYDESKPFKQKHWEALCRYLESSKRTDYYRILNKGIQFLNYVGVIQAGNLTIEVLPKIDKAATTAANQSITERKDKEATEQTTWQTALLQMLKECRLLQVHHVDYASLRLRSHSILDVYIELFLHETETLLHEGLLKKYCKAEGNRSALKGQLLFQKQLAYNLTHAERFYVRHTEYNRNNVYNQILYKTVRLISSITTNPHLHAKASALLLDFPEVSSLTVTAETFNRLTFDRKTERYKEALLIAKMLLLNHRPDITGGSENVMAILFDMNRLWEEWVYRRLKKEEQAFGITVQRQQSKHFWTLEDAQPKSIRPDIVIKNGDETIVLDTKWKLVQGMTPSDDDLKQMFVYNLHWNCDKSVLLYPALQPNTSLGDYSKFPNAVKEKSGCLIFMASLFSEGSNKIDDSFGITVLKIIFNGVPKPTFFTDNIG